MKVLFVQKMAGISGSERYALNILPELRKRGIDASFLVVQHPANAGMNKGFVAELEAAGVPVFTINSRYTISPWLIWSIARLVRREKFDFLQTNLIHADVWGACVKKFFMPSLPVLSVKHGYNPAYQAKHGLDPSFVKLGQLSLLTKWAGRYANSVVCISSALENFLVKASLIDSQKLLTIPYGFNFSEVPTLVIPGGLRFGNPQIVVAGRIVPVKQHHLLLKILPDLVRKFPDLSVVMVGAGSLLDDLKRRTAELGLSKSVRWEGFRTNMHDYIRDSDLMVFPSAAEGFGLVVLEAWYHGKPVVAFDVPAINEIIESGVDGELVPPFDTEKFQQVISDLLDNEAELLKLGSAGKRKQSESYEISSMCERTIKVYRELLN